LAAIPVATDTPRRDSNVTELILARAVGTNITPKEAAMSKMLSTYGLTRLPFSKDTPTSEMLDTEALQAAREGMKPPWKARISGCRDRRFRFR